MIVDCDNVIHSPGARVGALDCNMHCTGNAAEICGAGDRINIFNGTVDAGLCPSV